MTSVACCTDFPKKLRREIMRKSRQLEHLLDFREGVFDDLAKYYAGRAKKNKGSSADKNIFGAAVLGDN